MATRNAHTKQKGKRHKTRSVKMPDGSIGHYKDGVLIKIIEKDGYVCIKGVDFD